MKTINDDHQQGFTIIELLVAMAVFSSMILIVSITLLQIGRMYYKGVITVRTQEASRTALASITDEIQFTSGVLVKAADQTFGSVTVSAYCIGDIRYSFVLNLRLSPGVGYDATNGQIEHVLWQDRSDAEGGGCTPSDLTQEDPYDSNAANGIQGKEFLAENMRLSQFRIDQANPTNPISVLVSIIYGDQDLMLLGDNPATVGPPETDWPIGCAPGQVGAAWCAKSELETQAMRRYKLPI